MHFDDLTQYSHYLTRPIDTAINVGWLDANHDFIRGAVAPALFDKLCHICASRGATDVHVNRLRSSTQCGICGRDEFEVPGCSDDLSIGMSEIWIPNPKGGFFVAPSMIIHFIADHEYRPPEVFMDAVMAFDLSAPFNGQQVYLKAVAGAF